MKRSFLAIAMSLVALVGFAQGNNLNDQSGKWNAGIVIGYGTDISKTIVWYQRCIRYC